MRVKKKKKTNDDYRTINGLGEAHEGSLRALKMLKEQSNEALEHTRINPAVVDFGDEQQLKTRDLIRA